MPLGSAAHIDYQLRSAGDVVTFGQQSGYGLLDSPDLDVSDQTGMRMRGYARVLVVREGRFTGLAEDQTVYFGGVPFVIRDIGSAGADGLRRLAVTRATPVDHLTIAPNPIILSAGGTVQLTATTYDVSNNVLTGRVVTWSSSDPTIVSVDSVTGFATAHVIGACTITATCEGKIGTDDVQWLPATPQEFMAAFNAIDPNTQIEHDWQVGYGHSLTAGFKPAIADQVGGGTDGFVSLVSDQGTGGGLYYDPAVPAGLTFVDTAITTFGSSKAVLANDLKQNRDWFQFEIGTWQGAGSFVHQSKIDDGAGASAWQLNIGDQLGIQPQWANASGGARTPDFFSIDRDVTAVQWRQYNNALAEMQWGFNRDHRIWTPRGTALLTSRTWRLGAEPGSGVDIRGDRRKVTSGRGLLSKAHLKLINDYAVARLGVPERTRRVVQLAGNSIMTFFTSVTWTDLVHATYDLGNVAVPGATFDDMLGRIARLDGLISDDAKRLKFILVPYEFTNGIRVGGATVAGEMQKYRNYVDQMRAIIPHAKIIWVTSLPIGGYDDTTIRFPFNALVRTEVTSRGGSAAGHYLLDWAAHPIMGLTSALPAPWGNDGGSGVPFKYFIDNVHPSTLGVELLTTDANMLKPVVTSIG